MRLKTKDFLSVLGFIQTLGSDISEKKVYISEEFIALPGFFTTYSCLGIPSSQECLSCLVKELPQIKLKAKGLPEYMEISEQDIIIDKYIFNSDFTLDNFNVLSNPYDSKEKVFLCKTYLKNLSTILDKIPKPLYLYESCFVSNDDTCYYSLFTGLFSNEPVDYCYLFQTSSSLLKKVCTYFDNFYKTDNGFLFFNLSDNFYLNLEINLSLVSAKANQILPNELVKNYKQIGNFIVLDNLKDLLQTFKDLKPLADKNNLVRFSTTRNNEDFHLKLQPYNELNTTAEVFLVFKDGCRYTKGSVNNEFIFNLNSLIKYFDLIKSKDNVKMYFSNIKPILFEQEVLHLDFLIMPALGLG